MPFEDGNLNINLIRQDDFRKIGRRLAKRLERRIRRRMNNADFGPEGNAGSPQYSTGEAFFDITEPSGMADTFRRVKGLSDDANYARFEGGYREYRNIYRGGGGGSQVELELTGEMKMSMSGTFEKVEGGVNAGLSFKGHSSLYDDTTPRERAELVNEQYQFIYLDKSEKRQIKDKTRDDIALAIVGEL